jgi:hypothetical protein
LVDEKNHYKVFSLSQNTPQKATLILAGVQQANPTIYYHPLNSTDIDGPVATGPWMETIGERRMHEQKYLGSFVRLSLEGLIIQSLYGFISR